MKLVTLFSGSSGNCTYLENGDGCFLIDAGVSMRQISKALFELGKSLSDIRAVFLTHEHIDHVRGIEGLLKQGITIYSNESTLHKLGGSANISGKRFETDTSFEAFDMEVHPFAISHDAVDPVGYRFTFSNGSSACVMTDTGIITEAMEKCILGAKAVVLESNHDPKMLLSGRYPYFLKRRIMGERGHLSNDDCAKLTKKLVESGTQNIILAHLSKENNLPDLAYITTKSYLEEMKISSKDLRLSVAPRAEMSELAVIG